MKFCDSYASYFNRIRAPETPLHSKDEVFDSDEEVKITKQEPIYWRVLLAEKNTNWLWYFLLSLV